MTLKPSAAAGTTLPTYDFSVNGGLHTDGLNDADEMNLYATSRYDQPYSGSDLEWLYRSQDIDGSSPQQPALAVSPDQLHQYLRRPTPSPLVLDRFLGAESRRVGK